MNNGPMPEEHKKRISDTLKGRPIKSIHKEGCQCAFCPARKPASKEVNYKKGNAHRGKKRSPFSPEWKEKIRVGRMKQVLPKKDTSIEVKLQTLLETHDISFEKHKAIQGQPDIFIAPNICIFADGDYWHSRPEVVERDKKTNAILTDEGYVILRLSESEINNNIDICLQKIKAVI